MKLLFATSFASISSLLLSLSLAFGQNVDSTVPPPADAAEDSPFSDPASNMSVSKEKYEAWKLLYQQTNAELKQKGDSSENTARAAATGKTALDFAIKNFGAEHPLVAESLLNLAAIYESQNRSDKANPLIKQAMAIDKNSFGASHPIVAKHLLRFAALYVANGKFDKAEPLFKRVLEIQEKSYGKTNPQLAETLRQLGGMYQKQRKFREAESALSRAADIAAKLYGENSLKIIPSLNCQASLYVAQNQFERAEPSLLRAKQILEKKNIDANDPAFFETLSLLETVNESQEKFEEAEELQKRVIAIDEKRNRVESEPLAAGFEYQRLAQLYGKQGKYAESAETWRKVISLYEKSAGTTSPIVARALQDLAKTYKKLEKREEAEECEARATKILAANP